MKYLAAFQVTKHVNPIKANGAIKLQTEHLLFPSGSGKFGNKTADFDETTLIVARIPETQSTVAKFISEEARTTLVDTLDMQPDTL